ncbi:probable splicing factor U2af large subunit B at C-terminar half [Coccomyxa sp. Obi]|nr:probable splicing factor U2af large subunit B at C-terminar half [Coccomyxa sp. Obi]
MTGDVDPPLHVENAADEKPSIMKETADDGKQAQVAVVQESVAEHEGTENFTSSIPSTVVPNGGNGESGVENGGSAEAVNGEDTQQGDKKANGGGKKENVVEKEGEKDVGKHDREKKDREKDKHREKDRHRDRDRERKDRHRDSDKKETRREKDDGKDRKRSDDRDRDSSRKRRERSPARDKDKDKDREKSKRSHSDRKSSRHRSKSRERRRSRSRDKRSRRRSKSRDRRGRRSKYSDSSSDDDLYGYVPRKRQEAPQQAGYSTSYVDPYAALRSNTITSTDPAEIARQMQEQQLKARQLVLQQQAASAVAAASKTQREVYVGNLVAGLVTDDALRQLFNSTMAAAFPNLSAQGLEAVVSVSMHSEGRYAFVELRTPEMASAALQLSNQVQLLGQSISVGRPSGYVDPSRAQLAASAAAAALSAFQAGDMQAMEYQLQQANLSVPGLNAPAAASPALGAAAASPAASRLPLPPPPAIAQAPVNMAASVEPSAPTQYLQVTGMVTPDVLADDEEYAEVIQDLQEECSKYGQVLRVLVPRPPNPASSNELFGSNNYGKAFAEFANVAGCIAAKAAIHGRLFAGETVLATYVTAEYFAQLR